MLKILNKTGIKARILFGVVFLMLAVMACSDLLSAPPVTLEVALVAAPTVTPSFDSAALSFSTDASVTVSVEYGKVSGTYTGSIPRTATTSTAHSVTLTDLDASTVYYYHVVSFLGTAKSYSSAEYSFTTASNPGSLSITVAPSATNPSYTSLAISWTTNVACNHVLEYGTSSGSYTSSTVTTTSPVSSHSETISGLLTGTRYYYRIHLLANGVNDVTSTEYYADTTTETAPTAAQKARGIWILGGISGSAITSTVTTIDLFDPVNNTWYANVTAGSTGTYTPVSFAAYAAYNGKLYVIGGYDSAGNVQSLVQIYDVATNSWTPGATTPTPRANIYASVLNGKIYIISGSQANSAVAWAGAPAPTGVCYEYTPGGSWVTKAGYTTTNNTERFTYTYGNVLYSIGGRSSATAVAALAHDGYVPSFNTVTSTTEVLMSTARTGVSGVVCKPSSYDHSLVLIGGISVITNTTGSFINYSSGTAPVGTMSNLVQYLAYPFAGPATWQTASNTYPGSGIAFGAAVITSATGSDRIYYFGGTTVLGGTAAGSFSCRWITPPQPPATWSSSWNNTADMPGSVGRWGHGAVTLYQ